jgi:predicted DNA-binding protein
MARRKVTFSLDVETVTRLRRSAERLSKPQSEVVREAIRDYSERIGKLSESERLGLLERFDDLVPRIPRRPLREVEKELQAIREARRASGRRTVGKRRG